MFADPDPKKLATEWPSGGLLFEAATSVEDQLWKNHSWQSSDKFRSTQYKRED